MPPKTRLGKLVDWEMKQVRDIFLDMLEPAAKKWWKDQLDLKAAKKPPKSVGAGKRTINKRAGK